jgi:hypothetical protein
MYIKKNDVKTLKLVVIQKSIVTRIKRLRGRRYPGYKRNRLPGARSSFEGQPVHSSLQ